MPIRPENKKLYPQNWKRIREKILQRAKNKCEFCGVENYAIGYRDENGKFIETVGIGEQDAAFLDKEKLIKIVLTIAHLHHNPLNNDENNLRALCQRCHLRYDLEHHKETRKKNKKLPLFERN